MSIGESAQAPAFATEPPAGVEIAREPGPIGESERIQTLDVLRGFALLGIFMVNMPLFAMPFMRGLLDPALAAAPLSERLAYSFVKLFFEYKFISLFSLLFGIGFVVQTMRAGKRGGGFIPRFVRRLVILLAIGLVHAVGLWFGDILLIYAVLGTVLLLVGSLSPRTLTILAGVALLTATVLGVGVGGLQYLLLSVSEEEIEAGYAEAGRIVASGEAPSGFAAIQAARFDPENPLWQDAEVRAFRDGPPADALAFRLVIFAYALIFAALGFGWHALAMFLLGAALMKSGFFAPDKKVWYRRLVWIALPFGLLLEGVVTVYTWWSGFEPTLGLVLLIPVHEVGSVLLMLGYVGAICLLMQRERFVRLTRPIAQAGRMALTVYLGETLLATGVMYWWGLGWFGSIERTGLIGFVLLLYALLVAFAVLWLRRFRSGPMEWLWRSLTYLRRQPLGRRARSRS